MSVAEQSEVRVSDGALRRFIGYRLKLAFNVFRADLCDVLAPYGLRMISYSALGVIVETPGLRPSTLAEALNIERPNLVSTLDDLEALGLIRRERDAADRRAYALSPTRRGVEVFGAAAAANEAHEAALLAGVPAEDAATLLRVLDHIQAKGARRS